MIPGAPPFGHRRIQVRSDAHLAEFEDSPTGRKKLGAFRKEHPEFRYRHTRRVAQAFPEIIPLGQKLPTKQP